MLRDLLTRALELLTPRPRCRRCGHPLTAEASVRRGIGPVCLRRERPWQGDPSDPAHCSGCGWHAITLDHAPGCPVGVAR